MRDQFLLDPDLIFLNHGSFGACPREVFEAQQRWQLEMERNPVAFLSRRSAALLLQAREQLARYLGAQAEHLVFVANATTGVNMVAQSLPLQPGDEVLATDHEYGACDATWQAHCERQGALYRRVEIPLVAIVRFVDGKVAHEHIYWDQASVLVQVGLLTPEGLPVAGVETARKVADRTLPSNRLMPAWAQSEDAPL